MFRCLYVHSRENTRTTVGNAELSSLHSRSLLKRDTPQPAEQRKRKYAPTCKSLQLKPRTPNGNRGVRLRPRIPQINQNRSHHPNAGTLSLYRRFHTRNARAPRKKNMANSAQNSIFVSVMLFYTYDGYGVYQFCNVLLEMPRFLT